MGGSRRGVGVSLPTIKTSCHRVVWCAALVAVVFKWNGKEEWCRQLCLSYAEFGFYK